MSSPFETLQRQLLFWSRTGRLNQSLLESLAKDLLPPKQLSDTLSLIKDPPFLTDFLSVVLLNAGAFLEESKAAILQSTAEDSPPQRGMGDWLTRLAQTPLLSRRHSTQLSSLFGYLLAKYKAGAPSTPYEKEAVPFQAIRRVNEEVFSNSFGGSKVNGQDVALLLLAHNPKREMFKDTLKDGRAIIGQLVKVMLEGDKNAIFSQSMERQCHAFKVYLCVWMQKYASLFALFYREVVKDGKGEKCNTFFWNIIPKRYPSFHSQCCSLHRSCSQKWGPLISIELMKKLLLNRFLLNPLLYSMLFAHERDKMELFVREANQIRVLFYDSKHVKEMFVGFLNERVEYGSGERQDEGVYLPQGVLFRIYRRLNADLNKVDTPKEIPPSLPAKRVLSQQEILQALLALKQFYSRVREHKQEKRAFWNKFKGGSFSKRLKKIRDEGLEINMYFT